MEIANGATVAQVSKTIGVTDPVGRPGRRTRDERTGKVLQEEVRLAGKRRCYGGKAEPASPIKA